MLKRAAVISLIFLVLVLSAATGPILSGLFVLLIEYEPENTIFMDGLVIFSESEFTDLMLALWLIHITMWVPFGFVMGISWERTRRKQRELESL